MSARSFAIAALFASLAACAGERTATVAGPPLTPVPPTPGASSAPSAVTCPVTARFVELGDGALSAISPCDVRFVAVASGKATVGVDVLGPGDVLMVRGDEDLAAHGSGLALLASYSPPKCDAQGPDARAERRVVRASAAPDLTFAKGAMHARLDVETGTPVYFGRLEGTAPVAEHQHDGAWELLCAIEGAGAFTMAGETKRVGPRTCTAIPPDTKHSWAPDAGVTLKAFQMYTPPGPEQRFKKLAAAPSPSR